MHKTDLLILKYLMKKGIHKWIVYNILQRISQLRCHCTTPFKHCQKCKTLIQTCLRCHPEMTNGLYPFPKEGLPKCLYCEDMYCADCANNLRTSKSVRFVCATCRDTCGFCEEMVVHSHHCGFKVCEECYRYKKIEVITKKSTYEICFGCKRRL